MVFIRFDATPYLVGLFTPQKLADFETRLALQDLLTWVAYVSVDQQGDVDVIGPTAFLVAGGIERTQLDTLLAYIGQVLREFYLNNVPTQYRNYGHRRVIFDGYMVIIKSGVDDYGNA